MAKKTIAYAMAGRRSFLETSCESKIEKSCAVVVMNYRDVTFMRDDEIEEEKENMDREDESKICDRRTKTLSTWKT